MGMKVLQMQERQTAVYWGAPTSDGMGGYTYAAPVEISVRWIDVATLFKNANGDEQVSKAKVYCNSTVMVIGGYVRLGTLASITGTNTQPRDIWDAHEIAQVITTPSMKGDFSSHGVYV